MTLDHKPPLPLVIDSTQLTCFRACRQKFYDEFILQLAPGVPSIDLHAGACFARALETVYNSIYIDKLDVREALQRAEVAFVMAWSDFSPPTTSAKTPLRMWEAVIDYFSAYPPLDDKIQPVISDGKPTCEFTFSLPLDKETTGLDFPQHPSGDPFIFAGRFDMLGRMGDRLVIRDEKTMSSHRDTWSESLTMRSQFLGYVFATRALGYAIDTVVVRGIVILKTKFHQLQAIKLYPSFLVDRWLEQTRRDLLTMVHCWETDYWDWNFGDSCTSYSGCPYLTLCTSPDPTRWHSTFRKRNWNPLAKDPEAPTTTT